MSSKVTADPDGMTNKSACHPAGKLLFYGLFGPLIGYLFFLSLIVIAFMVVGAKVVAGTGSFAIEHALILLPYAYIFGGPAGLATGAVATLVERSCASVWLSLFIVLISGGALAIIWFNVLFVAMQSQPVRAADFLGEGLDRALPIGAIGAFASAVCFALARFWCNRKMSSPSRW